MASRASTVTAIVRNSAEQRIVRQAAAEAERIRRRRAIETGAVELAERVLIAVGVDAVAEHASLDRSCLYAQARGSRPPRISTLLAALDLDPAKAAPAIDGLARQCGYRLVPIGAVDDDYEDVEEGDIAGAIVQLVDALHRRGIEAVDVGALRRRREERKAG